MKSWDLFSKTDPTSGETYIYRPSIQQILKYGLASLRKSPNTCLINLERPPTSTTTILSIVLRNSSKQSLPNQTLLLQIHCLFDQKGILNKYLRITRVLTVPTPKNTSPTPTLTVRVESPRSRSPRLVQSQSYSTKSPKESQPIKNTRARRSTKNLHKWRTLFRTILTPSSPTTPL